MRAFLPTLSGVAKSMHMTRWPTLSRPLAQQRRQAVLSGSRGRMDKARRVPWASSRCCAAPASHRHQHNKRENQIQHPLGFQTDMVMALPCHHSSHLAPAPSVLQLLPGQITCLQILLRSPQACFCNHMLQSLLHLRCLHMRR